eukprot:TRINITY_DN40234_c0_g1_i1.p1 TRINITY_DN40234_c0_g1~~TRINITY_DN40234_c0_g1_i1.p1  ORF type:complete len:938 (+),score=124.52 TRINITY_DN40234_c0_g1_i1:215-3028(+)
MARLRYTDCHQIECDCSIDGIEKLFPLVRRQRIADRIARGRRRLHRRLPTATHAAIATVTVVTTTTTTSYGFEGVGTSTSREEQIFQNRLPCWSDAVNAAKCCRGWPNTARATSSGGSGEIIGDDDAEHVGAAGCFDRTIFTARECCGTGESALFPVDEEEGEEGDGEEQSGVATKEILAFRAFSSGAEAAAATWQEGVGGHPEPHEQPRRASRVHPSEYASQRRWEARYLHASTVRVLRFEGTRVILHDFKGGWQFATNYEALARAGREPYDLGRRLLHLGPNETALDVGANLGLVSILLAKRAHWSSRIYALEPHPVLYRYLLWNLRENNVTALVRPLRIGGCDARRTRRGGGGRVSGVGGSGIRNLRPKSVVALWPWWEPRSASRALSELPRATLDRLHSRSRVPCLSFKELLAALAVRRLSLLKLDCEGCEWGFLGADGGALLVRLLREKRVKHIVGELHHAGQRADLRGRGRSRASTLLKALCTPAGFDLGRESLDGDNVACNEFMERCSVFYAPCSLVRRASPPKLSANEARFEKSSLPQPLPPLRRRTKAATRGTALAVAVGRFRRAPTAARVAKTLQVLASWHAPEEPLQAVNWANDVSGRLDLSWWKLGLWASLPASSTYRRLLARLSGGILAHVVLWSWCARQPVCVAQLGSRALELLRRAAAHSAAEALFQSLRQQTFVNVPWVHPWQAPARYVRGLRARPVWSMAELRTEGSSAVANLVAALRVGYPRILKDLQRIRSRRWPPAYGPELIRRPQNWTALMLYDGDNGGGAPVDFPDQPYQRRKLHSGLCAKFAPETCALLQDLLPGFLHPSLPYLQTDQEQVAFFHLAPGSQIEFHQATSNARLTMHLCLSGCRNESRLQVGPHLQRWREGQIIVFDDSFLHRVKIDPRLNRRGRWILHVMATHPGLDTPEKFALALREGNVWPS